VLTEQVPIETGADGVMRVSGSRVTLDVVVQAFQEGATAEEIAQQYPSVPLADVYQLIAYYLRHTSEIDEYLATRNRVAEQVREAVEQRWPSVTGVRERLLRRQRQVS
jgi:uncharacterized protein (DUF433 family)